jgi:hypothetical protein
MNSFTLISPSEECDQKLIFLREKRGFNLGWWAGAKRLEAGDRIRAHAGMKEMAGRGLAQRLEAPSGGIGIWEITGFLCVV